MTLAFPPTKTALPPHRVSGEIAIILAQPLVITCVGEIEYTEDDLRAHARAGRRRSRLPPRRVRPGRAVTRRHPRIGPASFRDQGRDAWRSGQPRPVLRAGSMPADAPPKPPGTAPRHVPPLGRARAHSVDPLDLAPEIARQIGQRQDLCRFSRAPRGQIEQRPTRCFRQQRRERIDLSLRVRPRLGWNHRSSSGGAAS